MQRHNHRPRPSQKGRRKGLVPKMPMLAADTTAGKLVASFLPRNTSFITVTSLPLYEIRNLEQTRPHKAPRELK